MAKPSGPPGEMEAALRANIIRVVDALVDELGVKRSIVAGILTGDTGFFSRFDKGSGFNVSTYDRLMAGMSAMWPAGAAWPGGVPRPAPAALSADQVQEIRARARPKGEQAA